VSLTTIILRNLRKNIKHYYLYVFALIFSSSLYFSFVTLQYDPSMDETKGSVKGAAALAAASVLLVAIVAIFLLYANTIFIKRRSREIGLFQLIGLTKTRILGIITAENMILYFGSVLVGISAGFVVSRLALMVLFRIIGLEEMAELRLSPGAILQTMLVFVVIYMLIIAMNYVFIKRQTILMLFQVASSTEQRVSKRSVAGTVVGISGLLLILLGYYVSTELFSGSFTSMGELAFAMIFILSAVIIGTYLFYKGSVGVIFNAIRRSKSGYLSIGEVLSLSSIMFRMKSNALLLTVITTVSALAIGLLSLSYISYYSSESQARYSVPNDFAFVDEQGKAQFADALDSQQIAYKVVHRQPIYVEADVSDITSVNVQSTLGDQPMITPVLSESMVEGIELEAGEAIFMGYNGALEKIFPSIGKGAFRLVGQSGSVELQLAGTREESVLYFMYSSGKPTIVVDDSAYEQLRLDIDPAVQKFTDYYGIDIPDPSAREQAEQYFSDEGLAESNKAFSQYADMMNSRMNMGLIMFIVAFLGLAFLITSGCILYFKQMNESEEEKPSYTILRKLGFTQSDLLRGIVFKQILNFGIPLAVGLSHSYFAVKSGWFFFGTELMTPMLIVMGVYTALYSIFGLLSVLYCKRVIKESL